VLEMAARRKHVRFWGQALIGFGMLFMGMGMMETVLKGIASSPTVHRMFGVIDCTPGADGAMPVGPALLGVLFGTVLTMTVQSSTASIGLLLALAGSGLVNYWSAIPILFGDNIGTTITAQLAALGGNRAARRTALVHTLFNLVGVTYMLLLFRVHWGGRPVYLQLVDAITNGDGFAGENIERHIANAHTLFNSANALVLLPFTGVLGWLAEHIIPVKRSEREETDIRYLEPHLLDTPPLALDQVTRELVYMGHLARKNIQVSYSAFRHGKSDVDDEVNRREEKIDGRQDAITKYLVELSRRDLDEQESRQLPLLLHAVNDLERIGDHAENLIELAHRVDEKKLPFSDVALDEMDRYFQTADEMFVLTLKALERSDRSAAAAALEKEKQLNEGQREMERGHYDRLEKGLCNVLSGVVFLDYVANVEKVGDHLTNIAEAVIERTDGEDEEREKLA